MSLEELFDLFKQAKDKAKEAEAMADNLKGQILTRARAKLELMNTSQDKAVVKCGEHKMSISVVTDNPGTVITQDMVGTVTGKRKGYVNVRIS